MRNQYIETISHNEAEWKAGYHAALAHRKLTIFGILVALALFAHRRFPLVIALAWATLVALAFLPIWIAFCIYELYRRRQLRAALQYRPPWEPFEDGDA